MNYQSFANSPEAAESDSSLLHPHENQYRTRPSVLSCFLQTTAIFFLLFILALGSAFFADKAIPQKVNASNRSEYGFDKMDRRIWHLERRVFELEKRAIMFEWAKLDESDDKED
ncbi:hypothetical protein JCM5353_004421 [Sporobolomyces roseus]